MGKNCHHLGSNSPPPPPQKLLTVLLLNNLEVLYKMTISVYTGNRGRVKMLITAYKKHQREEGEVFLDQMADKVVIVG